MGSLVMKRLCVLQSMCSEADLKDLGLPMGPRKKLLLMLQEEKGKKVGKGMDDTADLFVCIQCWLNG